MIKKYEGDLKITRFNAKSFLDLEEVNGSLDIGADAQLPVLTSVGGYLDIGADAQLPVLTSVGGYPLPDEDTAKARIKAVAVAALATDAALDMKTWHTCETSHCIGGWAVIQAGAEGRRLEDEVGTHTAANILLGIEATKMFFVSTEKARVWLREKAAA